MKATTCCLLTLLAVYASVASAAGRRHLLQQPVTLHIAHVNDVHNRIEQADGSQAACSASKAAEGKCFGGYARIAAELQRLRADAAKEGAGFLFLNAGDEFLGTLWDVLYKGSATAMLQRLDSVKPDAMTTGNHEYDYGPANLAAYIRNTSHPLLGACNTDASKDANMAGLLKKYVVLERAGLKIGVVGWITPDTAFLSQPGPNITFLPVNTSVPACIKEMKAAESVDLVIGLSHTGYAEDLAAAAAIPELDLIIGGHSHTFLYTPTTAGPITDITVANASASTCAAASACDVPSGPYPTFVDAKTAAGKNKVVPVVQAYYASKYMGLIKLQVMKGQGIVNTTGSPILLGGSNSSNPVPQDQAMIAAYMPLEAAVDALNGQTVGRANVRLEGDRQIVRRNETNLGNFICDAMVAEAKSLPNFEAREGPVNICMMNSGGIRASINAGSVSFGDVITVLPFGNVLAIVSLTGQQILDSLAHSTNQLPAAGRFLQLAGLRHYHRNGTLVAGFLFDATTGVQTPIAANTTYNIVTNDYLSRGGDGFDSIAAGTIILPSGTPLDQLIVARLQAAGDAGVSPTTDGRIIDCATLTCDSSGPRTVIQETCCAGTPAAGRRRS